ncbi:hypothetical protein PMKS-003453 [Pichia membranifaciens]|uniref:non-specific serine/threonine protein kinase n=1 Tax=Pichia membranifaciens TaxID=4926 RepID=A0A1Q2YK77_9ASCO|nr:hypothetical protein PMKS-003453 [Pichia membranifaciens]
MVADKRPISQKYKLLEIIGRGKFGTVHKGLDIDTKQLIAVKILNLDTDHEEVKDIQQEIQFLSNLKSVPNITHYYGSYLNGHKLWIIMDYCAGGSVRTLLKPGPLQEKYIAVVTRELLIALQFIHENGVIHRDIKAANILISKDGKVKLCDFGVAAQLTSTALKRTTMAGTPYWMAPEVITEGATYNFKADIWSTGITIYEMATGNPPYSDKDALRAMQFITQHEPPRLEGRQYGPLLKEIIAICLEEKQDLRPNAEELLRSKFIKNTKALSTVLLKEVIGKYLVWRDTKSKNDMLQIEDEPCATLNTKQSNLNHFKPPHHAGSSASSLAETSLSLEDGENYDVKWDFDSLKSAEYIVENDINLANDENDKFDESFFETDNNFRDFTTSPYNRTFTMGNTMVNNVMGDNSKVTLTANGTQKDTMMNSHMDTPIKKEAPRSLLQLFSDVTDDSNVAEVFNCNNGNVIDIENEKRDLSISIPPPKQSQDIVPTPVQLRQPVTSPMISIEIPNMEVIENEIQQREKQRSRAATITAMNHITKVEALINDQPLPARKPAISVSHRTPSPAKALDNINTNLQSSPSKQSSPLHMKPLPVAISQPLLQPLNNSHKPKIQQSLANITTTHTSVSHGGPQTAPVTTASNSEMLDSSIRTRAQMRIQMPVPVSATMSAFPSTFSKENSFASKQNLSILPNHENSEKNQFGFDVNAASSIPLAMTPVTEKPHTSIVTPEKENSNDNGVVNSGPFGFASSSSLASHIHGSQASMKSYQHGYATTISNSAAANNFTFNERKMSTESANKYQTHQSNHSVQQTSEIQQRNGSTTSTSDDSEQADITLTNANTTASNNTSSSNVDNIVTGLGMMTMHDNGNVSPVKANGTSQCAFAGEKLQKVVDLSQLSMNKMMNLSLSMGISEPEESNETNAYIEEIDNLLGRVNDVMGIIVGGFE